MTTQEILTLLRGLKRWDVSVDDTDVVALNESDDGSLVCHEDLAAAIAQIEGEN